MPRSTRTQYRPKDAAVRVASGFTLVELLVVIAIIGILVALLLPAVQAAREAARRVQCKDNVKNISLGVLLHVDAYKFFPSGGWGLDWTADPNRGYGPDQPGSWAYNILEYIEEGALRDLGHGLATSDPAFRQPSITLHQTPVEIFHCPSRRTPKIYPATWTPTVREQPWLQGVARRGGGIVKGDYAANVGDSVWSSADIMWRPSSYSQLADAKWTPTNMCDPADADTYEFCQTGIMYYRSKIRTAQITDGTTKTYLVGEKSLDPDAYEGTADDESPAFTYGENQSLYTGFEWDNGRLAFQPDWSLLGEENYQPLRDYPGSDYYYAFGSAHSGGFNMAFCDGSVQTISYDIDQTAHRWLANRFDGKLSDAEGAF